MQNLKSFSALTIGEKHKAVGKVCQDAANHLEDIVKGLFISVLSDGHGSNVYFRSHIGAKLLVEITTKALHSFILDIDDKLMDENIIAMPSRTTIAQKDLNIKPPKADQALRQLFSSIIAQWNDAIYKDWYKQKPGAKELEDAKVDDNYIRRFLDDKEIEMAYGCTLLAIARTPRYWLGFQLGDGKCMAFDKEGAWSEPIPWDEQCSGNLTTSMCQSNPLDNFRYAYGSEFFPVLFIGSDGMDGAYGQDEEIAMQNLALLYSGMIKSFARNGFDKALSDIKDTLPRLSAKGISQDDISVGGILDMDTIKEMYPLLLKKELEQSRETYETIAKETDAKQNEVIDLETRVNEKKESFNQLKEQLQVAEEEKEKHEQNWKKVFKEKEKSQQKWEDLQASLQKLETELNQLSDDLSFEKNYFRRIIKEEDDLKSKIENLKSEILQVGHNDLINHKKN